MSKMFRVPFVVAALVVAAVALAACAGDDGGGSSATPTPTPTQAPVDGGNDAGNGGGGGSATIVGVELSEWAISPDSATAPAGEVTFEVSNTGGLPHELVILKTDMPHGELPGTGGVVDVNADGLQLIGEVEEFPAGQTQSGTFTLEPGNYALICNIAGHYPAGMHIDFVVE